MKYRVTKCYRVWEEYVVNADDEDSAIELADAEGVLDTTDRSLEDVTAEQE